jgi:hypothetical protein
VSISLYGVPWREDPFSSISQEFLDLSYTFLSGTIPTEFGKLSVLKHLELQVLNAIGSIPSELGLLTKLGKCGI